MNKKLYLLSIALLILVALLSALQGTRFIRSPVGVFQLATLLNMVMPVVLGALVAFFLAVRFADVWRGHADVQVRASRPIANASQTAGKLLVGSACGILKHGFARVRCGSCKHEFLLAFSCKCRYFCPPGRRNGIAPV
jgi:hypothetical protein